LCVSIITNNSIQDSIRNNNKNKTKEPKQLLSFIDSLSDSGRWFYVIVAIAIITLLGNWIAQRISHGLSTIRDRKNNIRSAVQKFKSAFRDQISNARGVGKFYEGDMASGFSQHESAVQYIMSVLPKRYQRKIKKAWDDYTGKGNDLGFSPEEYVRTMWACVELGQPEISENIEKKFHNLFTCLDDFIN
jgi:hypothetical protein